MENETKYKNLKPNRSINELTEEERIKQKEICRKGAYAMLEKKRAKKTMQETFKAFCEMDISEDDAKDLIGKFSKYMGDEMTIQSLITALALKIGLEDGNVKALEFLRDTSGNKPKDVQEIKADIMTESDKKLLANVAKRVNVSTDDGQ